MDDQVSVKMITDSVYPMKEKKRSVLLAAAQEETDNQKTEWQELMDDQTSV